MTLTKKIFVLAAVAMIAACTTNETQPFGTGKSISIPYDPYDYDPDDLLAEAKTHCNAFGLRPVFDGETVDPQSVRWRYRHYRCQ